MRVKGGVGQRRDGRERKEKGEERVGAP